MAEKATSKKAPADKLVRVKVLRAVCNGGVVVRPTYDGKRRVPVEAVMPLSRAQAQGPRRVEIIGDADVTDANKQATGEIAVNK